MERRAGMRRCRGEEREIESERCVGERYLVPLSNTNRD